MSQGVGLKELVQSLRAELSGAVKAWKPGDVRFELGDIELTLQMTVQQSTSGSAGVQVWVLSGNAARGSSESTVHTIKLMLKPRSVSGQPLEPLLDRGDSSGG